MIIQHKQVKTKKVYRNNHVHVYNNNSHLNVDDYNIQINVSFVAYYNQAINVNISIIKITNLCTSL